MQTVKPIELLQKNMRQDDQQPTATFPSYPLSSWRKHLRGVGLACTVATILSAALLTANPVQAGDEANDVSKLIKAGQLEQATAKADAFLANKPKDAQMRFLKGVILTERNKISEAITVFTRLSEDYPELPEPYNNLAVLYASQNQFDKARTALEQAIRTHPSYATAHENLGDIYAKLASQSYDKALQLDGGNATAQTKLSMIKDLISGKRNTGATQTAAAPKTPNLPPPTAAPVAPPPTPPAAISPPPAPVAAPSPAKQGDEDAEKAVQQWAKAWSAQDIEQYLSHYSKDFSPPSGGSRKRWEQERRQRIQGKSRISVRVDQLNVSVDGSGNKAIAKFKQSYSSDKLSNVSSKTLVLHKQGGRWLIVEERSS